MTGTPRALPPHAFRKLLSGSWLELVAVQHLANGRVGHVDNVDNPPERGHSIRHNVGA